VKQLRDGKPAWVNADGPRGYVSRIDGSVQPYTLLVPTDFTPQDKKPLRLDLWCHGRDEKLTELNFISGKAGNANDPGPGKLCLILYGRYCNANKFAGEIDVLEAMEDVKKRHPIDADRVVLTGFSMGGASVWHLTAHYADRCAAASPGAGFADTPIYMGLARRGALDQVPWYERKLWHWYDCTDWAVNYSNCPTIAYAGELDKQILASETMEKALAAEGLKLERLVGPKTEHKYEPETKKELDRRLDAYAAKGRDRASTKVRFDTWTLRYDGMHWLTIDAMEKHWERARVEAEHLDGPTTFRVKTQNVAALTLRFPSPPAILPGQRPWVQLSAEIDGERVEGVPRHGFGSLSLVKSEGKWKVGSPDESRPRKRHGLQGPIDDAFLDRFVIVKPTGRPLNDKVGAWAAAECDRAIDQWRKIFRGEAQVRRDDEVTDEDIQQSNLVLFGDPSSNKLTAKVADKLPIRWTGEAIAVGQQTYPADHHVPVLIYPNPLNSKKYVVLNSGFTFREAHHLSNAQQTPKLPDYAVVDVTVPPSPYAPGKVVDAGFFGEKWQLLPDSGRGER
jgi:dienelactone hydrolase